MPDGAVAQAPPADPPSEVTPAEARLLRSVRINLALWSGGITLAVLLVLGTVLYLAVERSLAASGTAQLVAQANQITGGRRDPGRRAAARRPELRRPEFRNVHDGRRW